MINTKKGLAHSLQQSDFIGNAKTSEGVVAGMLVQLDTNGDITKAGAAASATNTAAVNTARYGFASANQTDGDVVECGKIGAYALDGNSVIETDQTTAAVTAGNYPVGSQVQPAVTNTGLLTTLGTNGRVVGTVVGIRTIRGTALLAIKLAS